MDIRVSFDVYHKFIADDGTLYMTDTWNEEDVDIEVDDLEEKTVMNAVINSASEHARYLIIDCKKYYYIDGEIDYDEDCKDDFETIPGLKLIESFITHVRYDCEDYYDVDMPVEHRVKYL